MKRTEDVIVTKIIEFRKEGNTMPDIAKMVGVSTSTVFMILQLHAPHLCRNGFRCEGELYDNIINDIHQEFSCRQIAEKYSVSPFHVRKVLQHHHLNPCEKCKNIGRQPYRFSSDSIQKRREIVLELFQSGMPCLKIANKLKFGYGYC
jgi:transposase